MELPGANIIVEGLNMGAASDIQGNYLIRRVPVGEQTIKVTYLGYKDATATVTVSAGQSVVNDFTLEQTSIAGEEVVVWGSPDQRPGTGIESTKKCSKHKNYRCFGSNGSIS